MLPPPLAGDDGGTYIERMAQLDTRQKLEILADAAKYDASCASSGTAKRNSRDGKGLGSTEGMGICHAYAPDGRCISLLKISYILYKQKMTLFAEGKNLQ